MAPISQAFMRRVKEEALDLIIYMCFPAGLRRHLLQGLSKL